MTSKEYSLSRQIYVFPQFPIFSISQIIWSMIVVERTTEYTNRRNFQIKKFATLILMCFAPRNLFQIWFNLGSELHAYPALLLIFGVLFFVFLNSSIYTFFNHLAPLFGFINGIGRARFFVYVVQKAENSDFISWAMTLGCLFSILDSLFEMICRYGYGGQKTKMSCILTNFYRCLICMLDYLITCPNVIATLMGGPYNRGPTFAVFAIALGIFDAICSIPQSQNAGTHAIPLPQNQKKTRKYLK